MSPLNKGRGAGQREGDTDRQTLAASCDGGGNASQTDMSSQGCQVDDNSNNNNMVIKKKKSLFAKDWE